MRVEIGELCPSCLRLPFGRTGRTVEEMLNVLYNDKAIHNQCGGDRGVLSMLYTVLNDGGNYCQCSRLVLDRLPPSMRR